jgi:hypothetical protein
VGFEPAIPVFERAKKIHALDRAATVIGLVNSAVGCFVRKMKAVGHISFWSVLIMLISWVK